MSKIKVKRKEEDFSNLVGKFRLKLLKLIEEVEKELESEGHGS